MIGPGACFRTDRVTCDLVGFACSHNCLNSACIANFVIEPSLNTRDLAVSAKRLPSGRVRPLPRIPRSRIISGCV